MQREGCAGGRWKEERVVEMGRGGEASQAPVTGADCPMIIVKRSALLLGQTVEQKICANTQTHIRMSPPLLLWCSLESSWNTTALWYKKGRNEIWIRAEEVMLPVFQRCLVRIKGVSGGWVKANNKVRADTVKNKHKSTCQVQNRD